MIYFLWGVLRSAAKYKYANIITSPAPDIMMQSVCGKGLHNRPDIIFAAQKPAHMPTPKGKNHKGVHILSGAGGKNKSGTKTALSILVAEDNVANQLVAKTLLMRAGHSVTTVCNGKEAIQACQLHVFDVILMDIEMPDINGIEATEIIRRMDTPNRNVKIIALTAYGSASEKYTYKQSGIDNVINKPFKIRDLNVILGHESEPKLFTSTQKQIAEYDMDLGSNLPLLDQITLQDLLAFGDVEELRPMTKSYWQSAYSLLSDMQNAKQIWNRDALRKAAHALKGASANMGLLRLSYLAAQLQNSSTGDVASLLDEVDACMARSRKALKTYLDNYQNSSARL